MYRLSAKLTQAKKDLSFYAGGMTTDGGGGKVKKDACSGDSGGALECLDSSGL